METIPVGEVVTAMDHDSNWERIKNEAIPNVGQDGVNGPKQRSCMHLLMILTIRYEKKE